MRLDKRITLSQDRSIWSGFFYGGIYGSAYSRTAYRGGE